MSNIEWRAIKDYEYLYMISNTGLIKSLHLDGNKLNNNVDNLEWVTPKENTKRAWNKGLAKYTDERRRKLSKIVKEKWNTNSFRKWRGIKTT